MKSISVEGLRKILGDQGSDNIVIDIREPFEHRSAAIPGSENIPTDELDETIEKLKQMGTVYVHCSTGNRSPQACKILEEKGVDVVNVEGGVDAWEDAGYAVESDGSHAIPLIRQVLLIVGIMVLTGLSLGLYVNQYWYALIVVPGIGMIIAGTTGFCGMTHILKHMPWNK